MAFFIAPIGNSQFIDANGDPLVGGKIYTYLAGSTTATATYTDNTGGTSHANPIILNSLGVPASPIWLAEGIAYKFVVKDSNDVTLAGLGGDNIEGVNDAATSASEWVASGFVPTYLTATTFSVPGDQTDTLLLGRRLRTSNTAGLRYSSISASSFAASITTVTVVNDSGVLDAGLSVVSYGLLSPINSSIPRSGVASYTTTAALTSDDLNRHAYYTGAAAGTLTLPPVATVPVGSTVSISNIGVGLVTVGKGTASGIYAKGQGAAASITVALGESVNMLYDGGNWVQVTLSQMPLGVGQTWQDMTASRALATTYTNTTGRPIVIAASIASSGAGDMNLSPTVNGVAHPVQVVFANAASYLAKDSIVIPAGGTYSLAAGGAAAPALSQWFELRA